MTVYFNSEAIAVNNNASLHQLLEIKGFDSKKGIAVAVNNKVIKKQDWQSSTLLENDKVLVISATKGG
jgi:sulfur carrier protein